MGGFCVYYQYGKTLVGRENIYMPKVPCKGQCDARRGMGRNMSALFFKTYQNKLKKGSAVRQTHRPYDFIKL